MRISDFLAIRPNSGGECAGGGLVELKSVQLLKFGIAQNDTPLMECKLSSDADMALDALAQEDVSDPVRPGYNLSQFHVTRHSAKASAVVRQRSREAPHRLVDIATK